jgi:hypothetical protein
MTLQGAEELFVRRYQAAVSMRLGARLAGAELALLSRLGTAGWTADRQRLLFGDLHAHIMQLCRAARWSLLTNFFAPGVVVLRVRCYGPSLRLLHESHVRRLDRKCGDYPRRRAAAYALHARCFASSA